jgi:lipopolysaccharide export system protein LptC
MSVYQIAPLSAAPQHTTPSRRLVGSRDGRRSRIPSASEMARRRWILLGTKLLLPLCALGLLSTIALWPEIDHQQDEERVTLRSLTNHAIDGATLTNARYRGIDEHNRPYTFTAVSATQVTPERIDLKSPKGDITLENGVWVYAEARYGILIQHMNQLDLWQDVLLYRDDGMTARTQTATLDLKAGAATGADPVHVEGPIGSLDAIGFATMDKGHSMQFGPGNAVLNAAEHSHAEPDQPVHLETIPDNPPLRVQFTQPDRAGPEVPR